VRLASQQSHQADLQQLHLPNMGSTTKNLTQGAVKKKKKSLAPFKGPAIAFDVLSASERSSQSPSRKRDKSLHSGAQQSSGAADSNFQSESQARPIDDSKVAIEYRRAFLQNRQRFGDLQRNIKKMFDDVDRPFIAHGTKKRGTLGEENGIGKLGAITLAKIKTRRRRQNVFQRLSLVKKIKPIKESNSTPFVPVEDVDDDVLAQMAGQELGGGAETLARANLQMEASLDLAQRIAERDVDGSTSNERGRQPSTSSRERLDNSKLESAVGKADDDYASIKLVLNDIHQIEEEQLEKSRAGDSKSSLVARLNAHGVS